MPPEDSVSRRRPSADKTSEDVFCLCSRASDEGEGGVEDDDGSARHRALAEGGPENRAQLRPALPRRLLRSHYLPPGNQIIPCSGRRSHRHRPRLTAYPRLSLIMFAK